MANEKIFVRDSMLVRFGLACACGVGLLLSGCATTYKICLPTAGECSEVKTYRKAAGVTLNVTPEGGVFIKLEDIDSQSGSPLERAAADAIRAHIPK